jgi:hypothetical protein
MYATERKHRPRTGSRNYDQTTSLRLILFLSGKTSLYCFQQAQGQVQRRSASRNTFNDEKSDRTPLQHGAYRVSCRRDRNCDVSLFTERFAIFFWILHLFHPNEHTLQSMQSHTEGRPSKLLRLCLTIPKVRIISQAALKLLALIHLAHCTHEVFMHSVVPLITNGKHSRLRADVAQVSAIEVLC